MDTALKLRELRRGSGLSQQDVADISGVGSKTISATECGRRDSTLRIGELKNILDAYGTTLGEFFAEPIEDAAEPVSDPEHERCDISPSLACDECREIWDRIIADRGMASC